MAQILGQSGRYVSDQAANRRRQLLLSCLIMVAVSGVVLGVDLAGLFPPLVVNTWLRLVVLLLLLILLLSSTAWMMSKIKQMEREQKCYERGAAGEDVVSKELARFPNDFYVLNDVRTDYGNLDHVVIGPAGVYVIDAKNWRGIVGADGRDELLLNGNPTDKPECKNLVRRMMAIKEKVDTLARSKTVRFQALIAFTSARVEAPWGKTGNVNCMSEDRLYRYIVEKDFGARLKPEQTQQIARAFAQLAHMEVDFTERA